MLYDYTDKEFFEPIKKYWNSIKKCLKKNSNRIRCIKAKW